MKIQIYTKGDKIFGYGHVYRMKYLAEILSARGHEISYDSDANNDCILCDALTIPRNALRKLRNFTKKLILFDYNGSYGTLADIRINALYPPKNPPKNMWTGYEYLLLHPAYSQTTHSVKKEATTVLVAQGGGDTYGDIPKLINIILPVSSGITIIPFQGISEPWNLFPSIDLAITGGGMTVFELLCSGVPCLAFTNEPKERPTLSALTKRGFCKPCTPVNYLSLLTDYESRNNMSVMGKQLIDGLGYKRIVDIIEEGI